MAEGESLRAICRDVDTPSEGAVRGWAVRDVDGFGDRYRAARLLLMDYWADQIVDIADDGDLDPRVARCAPASDSGSCRRFPAVTASASYTAEIRNLQCE